VVRKRDIRIVDQIVQQVGLSREQRRLLHDEMSRERLGRDHERHEILKLAQQILHDYPGKRPPVDEVPDDGDVVTPG
jgi:hypothetical protein